MLQFTLSDKELLNTYYQNFLKNLKTELEKKLEKNSLEMVKIIIKALHEGKFSGNNTFHITNDFEWLYFPSDMDYGMQIFYGISCCRHATGFLKSILDILEIPTSYLYVVTNKHSWDCVKPTEANHIVLQYFDQDIKYLIDPINKLILKIYPNGNIQSLDITTDFSLTFQDENIKNGSLILKKYYHLKALNITHIYDYDI